MLDLSQSMAAILATRTAVDRERSILVGVSGIDGSGKGHVTAEIAADLTRHGQGIANINIDGWLNLPVRRFSQIRPAQHFYEHAIRFHDMFEQLVLPLKAHRALRLVADFAEETATAYRPHTYEFANVDIMLLEGIYLFKREWRPHFDLALWVECTFQTALERALQRSQEGLPPDETIRAYETIYFPAQRIHFVRDDPRGAAHLIVPNDPRLTALGPSSGGRPPSEGGDANAPAPGGA
jgi:uridine kinase